MGSQRPSTGLLTGQRVSLGGSGAGRVYASETESECQTLKMWSKKAHCWETVTLSRFCAWGFVQVWPVADRVDPGIQAGVPPPRWQHVSLFCWKKKANSRTKLWAAKTKEKMDSRAMAYTDTENWEEIGWRCVVQKRNRQTNFLSPVRWSHFPTQSLASYYHQAARRVSESLICGCQKQHDLAL